MISRIVNNKDVSITEDIVNQLAYSLKIGKEGHDRMRYYANPRLAVYDEALQEGIDNVVEVNCMFAENGLPPVGIDLLE